MAFDVQEVDLEQLADVAQKGGIDALMELANKGEMPAKADPEKVEPEVPTDPEKTDPEPAKASETPDPEKTDPEKKPEPADKEQPTAVSTKDGKGTIPYAVLKTARERAMSMEGENAVLRKQVADLTERMESGAPATAAEAAGAADEVDAQILEMQEKVNALEEEYPEMAALLTGQVNLLKATRQQLVQVQKQFADREQQEDDKAKAGVQETLQEAIDGNETLALWQSKQGAEWEAAIAIDAMLKVKPEWAGKTFSERFTKVVETVRVMNPEFEAAPDPTPPAPAPASTDLKDKATPSDKRPAPINSLSDLPGGVPPAGSQREQVEGMSGASLGNKFMNMSPDAMQEYLASLGI